MFEITHPTEAELEQTLHFAFNHLPVEEYEPRIESIMQQHHAGNLDLRGIIQAKYTVRAEQDGNNIDNLVGAMVAQNRLDGTVMLWVPALQKEVPLEPMMEPLVQFCQSYNAHAVLAVADRNQPFDERLFCSVGHFRYLSDMVYLVSQLSVDVPFSTHPNPLQFIPLSDYAEDISETLTRLVQATYHETLDFPELMQIASAEKVLQGYKANTPYKPDLWFFIQENGVDVGVLLLSDLGPEMFELTYMGLIASARRRGLSQQIVQFAQQTARRANRFLLLTSVDARNQPACQAYLSHGFKVWDRKKLYVRFF